jgi:hypothetical protein
VHRQRKVEEDLAWFDRYLFRTYEEPNEALKEGSPLDLALKKERFGRVGTRYGVEVRDTLVPEVVEFKGLTVGRFEVTRAQYAAYDASTPPTTPTIDSSPAPKTTRPTGFPSSKRRLTRPGWQT